MIRYGGTLTIRTLCALMLVVAGYATAPLPAEAGLWDGTVKMIDGIINGGQRTHIEWTDDSTGRRVEFDVRGEIEFSDDDRDVASLSPGGSLELEIRQRGQTRRVRMEADRRGRIERSWSTGDGWQEWNSEAAEWLAEALPALIRESGIGAEARVERILAAKGAGGVLAEIDLIESDWARSRYLLALVDQADLVPDQQVRALEAVRRGESDYEKSRVLRRPGWLELDHEAVRRSFLRTAETIDSDYESRQVLSTFLAEPNLPATAIEEVLGLTAAISSDYEKATVLLAIAPANLATSEAVSAYLKAAASIDSDYERRRAMGSLLADKRLSRADTARAIEAAGGIDSDYEKATLLIQTAKAQELDAAAQEAYLAAAESIGSAYEKRRALLALLEASDAEADVLARLARTTASISSDYEKASVLIQLAKEAGLGGEAERELLRVAASIASNYERQRALRAYLESAEPERDNLLAVLSLVETFTSDNEKASLLTRIAPRIDDEELERAYLEVAETLHSDGEYRRALRALHRQGGTPRRASGA